MIEEKVPLYVLAKGSFLGDAQEIRSFLWFCENSLYYDSAELVSREEFRKLKLKYESSKQRSRNW